MIKLVVGVKGVLGYDEQHQDNQYILNVPASPKTFQWIEMYMMICPCHQVANI